MSDLLLELFSEEMPAGMQGRATRDLEKLLGEALTRVGLTHGTVETFVTPRRLTIAVADIPEKSPDISEERKGPRVGAQEKSDRRVPEVRRPGESRSVRDQGR